jgi:3D (Asp-Asp-Asp) domain-containing protein
MKSVLGGGAALAATVLAGYALFYTQPLFAEPISLQQESTQQQKKQATKTEETNAQFEHVAAKNDKVETKNTEVTTAAGEHYLATAYAFRGKTATGQRVAKGIIAADPRVLPMGTRVRLDAGSWSGEYTVADTGGAIRGRKIDVWVPTTREAFSFGRRKVKLTVLTYGGRKRRTQNSGVRTQNSGLRTQDSGVRTQN